MQLRIALWTPLALFLLLLLALAPPAFVPLATAAAATELDDRFAIFRRDAEQDVETTGSIDPPAAAAEHDERLAIFHRDAEGDVVTTGSIGAAAGARTLGGFRAKVDAGAIWVRESAPTRCLPGDLREVVAEVAARFGEVRIMSTHRSARHNRRVGGARRSLHLDCRAIDFRVPNARGVMAFLREHPAVGGLKRYRNGIIHIDNGEPRRW